MMSKRVAQNIVLVAALGITTSACSENDAPQTQNNQSGSSSRISYVTASSSRAVPPVTTLSPETPAPKTMQIICRKAENRQYGSNATVAMERGGAFATLTCNNGGMPELLAKDGNTPLACEGLEPGQPIGIQCADSNQETVRFQQVGRSRYSFSCLTALPRIICPEPPKAASPSELQPSQQSEEPLQLTQGPQGPEQAQPQPTAPNLPPIRTPQEIITLACKNSPDPNRRISSFPQVEYREGDRSAGFSCTNRGIPFLVQDGGLLECDPAHDPLINIVCPDESPIDSPRRIDEASPGFPVISYDFSCRSRMPWVSTTCHEF